MINKSFITWIQTRNWCEMNPGKKAAIVTPYGRFEIVYKIQPDPGEKFNSIEIDRINNE